MSAVTMDPQPEAQQVQQRLFPDLEPVERTDPDGLHAALREFDEFGSRSIVTRTVAGGVAVPTYVNEFWTSKQRAASSLHEISYRACFKPQLPRFFIERLTEPGDIVYDPFLGRGTTMIETALLERVPIGCDLNPLSEVLVVPRLSPPTLDVVEARFDEIDLSWEGEVMEDLLVFYHPETLSQIRGLKHYLMRRRVDGKLDAVDRWIQMVAVNRLTGHSPGFFSVYTMPPNQAVTADAQRKINKRREQTPEPRDVRALILRKTKSLLADVDEDARTRLATSAVDFRVRVVTSPAAKTPQIEADSVRLVVTSPPFLDVVQYHDDNWLRCWFCDIDVDSVELSIHRKIEDWQAAMTEVFIELARVLQPGGYVAFEVGEVRGGKVRLEELAVPCGKAAGLDPVLILVNDQKFTKTANCWGVDNNQKGTNTNRVVVFRAT
jgi:hypothetical protein